MQNLYHNITGEQTVHLDAPEGRPSAVTSVTVFPLSTGDDGTAEEATTGVGTVEANPDTTFDAASGDGQANPRELNLTATTGMEVGRKYLATNAEGESELVEITSITGGASALARHNLRNAYASGTATLEGTRISIDVDDTWIADSANISDDLDTDPGYRVRWVYTAGGLLRVQDTYFNVVRYRADHDVTGQMVDAKRNGWIHNLSDENQEDRGRALIDSAYEDFRFDLIRRRIPSEMLRSRETVNYMTIKRTLMNSSKELAVRTSDVTAYDLDREDYFGALDGLIPDNTSIATDASGAGGKVEPLSIWER